MAVSANKQMTSQRNPMAGEQMVERKEDIHKRPLNQTMLELLVTCLGWWKWSYWRAVCGFAPKVASSSLVNGPDVEQEMKKRNR